MDFDLDLCLSRDCCVHRLNELMMMELCHYYVCVCVCVCVCLCVCLCVQRDVTNAGGITLLEHLLRTTEDIETCELVTGILWNLSSAQVCRSLSTFNKKNFIVRALYNYV